MGGIKKGNEEGQWEGIERGQGRNEENWIKRGGGIEGIKKGNVS